MVIILEVSMKKIFLTILMLILALNFVFALDDTNISKETVGTNIEINNKNNSLISNQELETKTVAEVADLYGINANKYAKRLGRYYGLEFKTNNKFSSLVDVYGLESAIAINIADSIVNGTPIPSPEIDPETAEKTEYHLSPIVLILVGAYILSRILSKKKINILTVINHKKIWNILLMIAFIISGVLGVLLVIRNNLGNTAPMRFDALFWHVELGIAMVIISVFHIIERWYYFARIFSKKRKTARKRKVNVKTSPSVG